jgi:predicted Zn-dependent protease
MHRFLPLACCAALLTSACGYGDAPVSDQERAVGAEQHPQLLAQFGGAYAGEEAGYLARLGEKIAGGADLQNQCTFTLVNTDVVNAFAVPGCYIYVTRGLMSIVNSEAELASVLAHELGHIAGNHNERQQRRALFRGLGVVAISAITGSERLSRIAGAAAALFTLRYSRSHEYEADDLGLKYLRAAGYDPHEAVDMLAALGRHQLFLTASRGRDEASGIPEWAMTHPLTEHRMARARAAAEESGVRPGALPDNEAGYLRELDGLLYGDDPEQGFVMGRRFAHPVMRIAFAAPPGFTLTNSPQAILIEGPDGLQGEFAGGPLPPGGLPAYAEAVLANMLGDAPVELGPASEAVINGVPALIVPAVVRTQQGPVSLTLAAFQGSGGDAFHFAMIARPGAPASQAVAELFASFRLLSAAEAASLRPRRIRTVQARPGDTPRSLAARMAADPPLGHFLMLNGRSAQDPLRPGELVKLVVVAPR